MAIMYPDKPREFEPLSGEDIMFDCLEKKLSDDFFVFHSFSIVTVQDGTIYESETDFVIYNERLGVLCLEAKNGQVNCSGGYWRYGSGKIMSHDGPYRQAANNKWKLGKYMTEGLGLWDIYNRCKMVHAVWFPSVSRERFEGISLPAESDLNITLTSDSEEHLQEEIEKIFAYELPNQKINKLGAKDTEVLIDRVFAPSFNLISLPEMKHGHNEHVFKVMLKEQISLLNYLEEQQSAVINGMAGTGKTAMAIRKAFIHAEKGEKVLFLCYNVKLKEFLQDFYKNENIFYYTIDGLACKLCNTSTPNYSLLQKVLADMYGGDFPYKNVIIDEGQDFGEVDEKNIINLLRMNVLDDETQNGTFYLFYDRNQMVHGNAVPEYIKDADCKLTLYKNCRNTINIATTSLRLLGEKKNPQIMEGALVGDSPLIYMANGLESTVKVLNDVIDDLWKNDYSNIQILTCKTEDNSIISKESSTGVYLYKKNKIPFTTCRKFKGLEADAIILIDIDKSELISGKNMVYMLELLEQNINYT